MHYNFIVDEKLSGGVRTESITKIKNFFDESEYTIYDCNIHDKSLIYIFLVGVYGYPSHDLNSVTKQKNPDWPESGDGEDGSIQIPQLIIDKYHSGFKISFLFFTTDESDNPDAVEIFSDYLDYIKINQKHFYLSTGNELLEKNKKRYNSEINVNTNNYLPLNVSKIMQTKIQKIFKKRDSSFIAYDDKEYDFRPSRTKLFQCFNNVLKAHRLGIYTFFNKENLLDKVDLSLIQYDSFKEEEHWRVNIFKDVLSSDKHEEWYEIASESIKNKKGLKSEHEKHIIDNQTGKQIYFRALHEVAVEQNLYKHGYISIITESQWEWENIVHITEKSIVPFFFHQIPIIVAPPNHVKCMKDRYGLDFFDDIINHNYDSIENHHLRFKALTDEILRLSKLEKEIHDFVKNNQNRFEKNKEIIKNIQHSKINKNFWRSLTYKE